MTIPLLLFLHLQLEELARSNALLVIEGDMMERFIARRGNKGTLMHDGGGSRAPNNLLPDQKIDLATEELEHSKTDVKNVALKGQTTIETLDALIKQSDLKLLDVRKEAYEFKRDVVLRGETEKGDGKIAAEAVVRFFEDGLRSKDTMIDKLRLKNTGLRAELAKLQAGVQSKAEASGVLHYIDFHQMQIENSQAKEKIEERNTELMRLKLTAGMAVSTLTKLRERVAEGVKEALRLRNENKVRSALLEKLKHENIAIAEIVEKQSELAAKLVSAARSARLMPQTIDYVEMNRTQATLKHEIDAWVRKVEVAELRAKGAKAKARASGIAISMPVMMLPSSRGDSSEFHIGGRGEGASAQGRTLSSSFFGSTSSSPAAVGAARGPGSEVASGARGRTAASDFSAGASTAGASMRTPQNIELHQLKEHNSGMTSSGGLSAAVGNASKRPPVAAALPSSSKTFMLASGGHLPNYTTPVSFGSTTNAPATGKRPMGSVTGATKVKPEGFRDAGFKPPRGAGGGFPGQITSGAAKGHSDGPKLFTGVPPRNNNIAQARGAFGEGKYEDEE